MGISKRAVALATGVACMGALLGGAAAGTSAPEKAPPPSPIKRLVAQVKGMSLSKRDAFLLNQAKKEGGTLEWYTSLSRTIGPEVVKAFEAQYPGIKVKMFRASSEDLVARITQEASAGTPGADVIETNGTEMLFFQHRKNVLVPYRESPYASAIPTSYRFDTWTGERIEAFIVAYNKNLVGGNPPKSFTDLTSSRWKGKLAMEPGDVDWFAALYQYLERQALKKFKKPTRAQVAAADRKIDAMFRGIAQNSQIVSGHTTQATLLAAGQFAVCVSCHAQSIEALAADGAPITFKPFVNPIIIRAQGIGIAYRLRHPATALLFYDWMLKKGGGQSALLKGGANPARKDMGDPDLAGAKRVALNLRPIVNRFGYWSKKYDSIVRLGGK